MRTLLDSHATLDADGSVQSGTGFRQASTPAFAFETGAVHGGPGVPHVHGPYPLFLTDRIFFLLCSAELPPAQVAKHRADNGLVGRANLTFNVPHRKFDGISGTYSQLISEEYHGGCFFPSVRIKRSPLNR